MVVAVVVIVLSFSFIYIQAQKTPLQPPQGETQLQRFYYYENTVYHIGGSGDAEADWAIEMPPSGFTDLEVITFTGGKMGDVTVRGMGVENAKVMYMAELQSSYAQYGQEMDYLTCDLPELAIGNPLRVKAKWRVPCLAHREEGVWRITIEPVDKKTYARYTLNRIKNIQANISLVSKMLSSDCQLVATSMMIYILPSGAEIGNIGELQNFKYRIDFGGGTTETDDVYISDVGGSPAVIMESQITISTRLISITEEEFLKDTKFGSIDYTGVPSPYDFMDYAPWATADLKYGGERNLYTISFQGREFEISPHQLLYYSAVEVTKLAESNGEPLLAGDGPIAVAPPEDESGDWDAFLRTLSTEDLVGLARVVRDCIDSTGKVPSTIESPIGNLRPRDTLFTFLRAISFYREHRALPNNLTFAPAPTGDLVKSGAEVPANLVYFTLGEKYVITGTPRVNQIISNLKQPNFSDSRFAENACGWVYQNITYPVPLILGWFTSEEVLDMKFGKCLDKANLYMAITRTAGLPTRRVTGFLIFDQVGPPFLDIAGITPEGKYIIGHAWTEVYVPGEGWLFADPTAGYFKMHRYDIEVYSKAEETWQEVLASYETTYGKLI